ncbi:MAG: magnesium transporter [bacterium]|nr:magnesium transporter [bacterium]
MKNLALFIPEIREFLEIGAEDRLQRLLQEFHPADIAEIFEELKLDEKVAVFRALQDEKAISVFEQLDTSLQQELLEVLSKKKTVEVLDEMASDERADLFSELEPKTIDRLFRLMKKEEVADVKKLLKYKEDTAGGIMTTDYVALREETTVEETTTYLREAVEAETISYIYVVDKEDRLTGVVSIRTFIMARPNIPISQIMTRDVVKVSVDTDQEEVAAIVAKYNLLAIPVVEDDNRLVGIVTVDDIIDVIEKEATEDIYKMTGTSPEEELLKAPVFKVAFIRLPWLFTFLIGGIIAGFVIRLFNVTLSEIITLTFFIPLIMGMAGNVGIQSSTIIVRGIAIGHIDIDRIKGILFKEIGIGLIMGGICGVGIGLITPFLRTETCVVETHLLGIIVGLSIFLALTAAAFVGTISPILFKKLHIDPAAASGPLVTATTDITGLLIYFVLATILIKYL